MFNPIFILSHVQIYIVNYSFHRLYRNSDFVGQIFALTLPTLNRDEHVVNNFSDSCFKIKPVQFMSVQADRLTFEFLLCIFFNFFEVFMIYFRRYCLFIFHFTLYVLHGEGLYKLKVLALVFRCPYYA